MIFSAAFYPELAKPGQIDKDIELMHNAGLNGVRMAEFAWSKMQPEENEYDFLWLDRFIEKLGRSGIKTVIGIPTAVPPKWMIDKYPDICQIMADGRSRGYGGRRNVCINNEKFREFAVNIAKRIAEHYKENKNVIAYQIDNELMAEQPYCYCSTCRRKFIERLKDKYVLIERLNDEWGLRFWSLDFPDWDSVEIPGKEGRQPSALKGFYEFTSDCYIEFAMELCKAIKEIDNLKIVTHNICSSGFLFRMDLKKLFSGLDVVSMDSYPVSYRMAREYGIETKTEFEPEEASFALALTRAYKNNHFWLTEKEVPHIDNPKQFSLLSFLELAHGCRMFSVFEWRKPPFGAERGHHSILSYNSAPGKIYDILKDTVTKLKNCPLPENALPAASVAIIRDFQTDFALEAFNSSSKTFNYLPFLYEFYKAVIHNHVNCDIITPEDDFSAYSLIIAPAWMVIDEERKTKIERYVNKGGTFVSTVFSSVINRENVCYMSTLPFLLDKLFGIEIEDTVRNVTEKKDLVTAEKCIFSADTAFDFVNIKTAETIAWLKHKNIENTPAVTVNCYGKGKAYYIACLPEQDCLKRLISDILKEKKIEIPVYCESDKVEIIKNICEGTQWYFVINFSGSEQTLHLNCKMTGTKTEEKLNFCRIIKPYEVLLLKRITD